MEESFRLGRIAGIRVGVNWSVLVIFWLISWSLAGAVLPQQAPGRPPGSYWLAGLLQGAGIRGARSRAAD